MCMYDGKNGYTTFGSSIQWWEFKIGKRIYYMLIEDEKGLVVISVGGIFKSSICRTVKIEDRNGNSGEVMTWYVCR